MTSLQISSHSSGAVILGSSKSHRRLQSESAGIFKHSSTIKLLLFFFFFFNLHHIHWPWSVVKKESGMGQVLGGYIPWVLQNHCLMRGREPEWDPLKLRTQADFLA